MADHPHYTFTASRLLVVIALIFFVLAAFHVSALPIDLSAAGLAFLAASFLVPQMGVLYFIGLIVVALFILRLAGLV